MGIVSEYVTGTTDTPEQACEPCECEPKQYDEAHIKHMDEWLRYQKERREHDMWRRMAEWR